MLSNHQDSQSEFSEFGSFSSFSNLSVQCLGLEHQRRTGLYDVTQKSDEETDQSVAWMQPCDHSEAVTEKVHSGILTVHFTDIEEPKYSHTELENENQIKEQNKAKEETKTKEENKMKDLKTNKENGGEHKENILRCRGKAIKSAISRYLQSRESVQEKSRKYRKSAEPHKKPNASILKTPRSKSSHVNFRKSGKEKSAPNKTVNTPGVEDGQTTPVETSVEDIVDFNENKDANKDAVFNRYFIDLDDLDREANVTDNQVRVVERMQKMYTKQSEFSKLRQEISGLTSTEKAQSTNSSLGSKMLQHNEAVKALLGRKASPFIYGVPPENLPKSAPPKKSGTPPSGASKRGGSIDKSPFNVLKTFQHGPSIANGVYACFSEFVVCKYL